MSVSAFQAMNAVVVKLKESRGAIVGGFEVPGLTNNVSFTQFEAQKPFQVPDS